nr:integrase, catalytic region, zinc finger, CCHC-type, peptidase aspartic, catalytic [Tanacetum cinerariifolium]
MLLAGSELTKEDRESQLYDEFKRFKMLPGENINEYYVRFHKLVNDMRNIRMTMPNIKLNSKFVNNMSPEWDRNFARGNVAAGNGRAHIRAGNVNACQGKPIKCFNSNGLRHIVRNCSQPKCQQNSDYFKDKRLLMQAQENGAVNECDAFDSDVDDEPTAQSIFMANLSSAGPTNEQAGPSNASILFETQQSPLHDLSSSLHPIASTKPIPTATPTEIPTLRQYSRSATWIAQSKTLPTAADEPASFLRDDRQGEAFPIVSGLEAGQDRENIIKTYSLPHDSTLRVASLDADEGTKGSRQEEGIDFEESFAPVA